MWAQMGAHVGYMVLYVAVLAAVQIQWRYCLPILSQVLKASQALLVVALIRLYSSAQGGEYNFEPHMASLQEFLNKSFTKKSS